MLGESYILVDPHYAKYWTDVKEGTEVLLQSRPSLKPAGLNKLDLKKEPFGYGSPFNRITGGLAHVDRPNERLVIGTWLDGTKYAFTLTSSLSNPRQYALNVKRMSALFDIFLKKVDTAHSLATVGQMINFNRENSIYMS